MGTSDPPVHLRAGSTYRTGLPRRLSSELTPGGTDKE